VQDAQVSRIHGCIGAMIREDEAQDEQMSWLHGCKGTTSLSVCCEFRSGLIHYAKQWEPEGRSDWGGTMCRKHKYRGYMDVKERCFLAYFFIAVDKRVTRPWVRIPTTTTLKTQ